MKNTNLKQVLISIIIGACVAFFSTLFESLADFMKSHATDIVAGGVTSFHYLAKNFKV